LDIFTFIIILVSAYAVISLIAWLYDKKINKFIVTEGEEEVEVPEKEEAKGEQEIPEEEEKESQDK
jgi:hypothetical protein